MSSLAERTPMLSTRGCWAGAQDGSVWSGAGSCPRRVWTASRRSISSPSCCIVRSLNEASPKRSFLGVLPFCQPDRSARERRPAAERSARGPTYAALDLRPIAAALFAGDLPTAKRLCRVAYPLAFERPHHPLPDPGRPPAEEGVQRSTRRQTPRLLTRLFLRDGFVDRYTGDPVVYPPVLRMLSLLLPTDFPFDSGWQKGAGHSAYWSLFATCDHAIPIARGGWTPKTTGTPARC